MANGKADPEIPQDALEALVFVLDALGATLCVSSVHMDGKQE